jgi:hypothetical protein
MAAGCQATHGRSPPAGAGHTVCFDEPTTMIEISPEEEMRELLAQVTDAVMEVSARTSTSP